MKLSKPIADKTKYFFNTKIPQIILFLIALLSFVILFFSKSNKISWTITGTFFLLSLLKRGKVMILPTIFLTIGITFFELLTPIGKILITIGTFQISEDSLLSGLHKSSILSGMLFISQFAVSPQLHIPGKAGLFLNKIFSYFELLTDKPISLKPGTIISSIDNRLLEIWEQDIL